MLSASMELDRLRYVLSNSGWESYELDEIIDLAGSEINHAIIDIVADAVAAATDYATGIGAEQFISELTVDEDGHGYKITTRSGTTDFSTPEKKMLPHLLKNADVAADGSRYKVIPVPDRSSSLPRSSFDVLRARQEDVQAAREAIKQKVRNRSDRAAAMADQFRQSLSRSINIKRQDRTQRTSGPVNFRTATDKQDVNTQWVIPEKEADMTQYLMGINDGIAISITEAVSGIIAYYEQEFM